ncbi:thiamine pyrophosphate-binding protein [Salinithrix halophila]|uniref:Thiamine pyrophosphate-binding protein n=2 Tax=Salinithrix halophila TaxID=1485204 RepID=A0ABV8JDJ2_9BACL
MTKPALISRMAAQYLVEQLAVWGVERIYGVIGDATLPLMDAIDRQGEIRYVGCRLEMTAALMASAEAKLTGRMAVCTATSGPGITSLLNGLGDAHMDRVPVLALTGQVERKEIGTGTKQEVDQQRLIQPLAVFSSLVADPQALPVLLNKAMRQATASGGVAHLSVPKELWMQTVDHSLFPPFPSQPAPLPRQEDVSQAAALLNGSSRPVILAGRGVKGAEEALLQLAERMGAPIVTTMPSRSAVPNDHPLFIGGLGQAGSDIASDLLKESDCCLILGSTWWPEDYVPSTVPIVQVDAVAEHIGERVPVTVPVTGEMRAVLSQLTPMVQARAETDWNRRVNQMRQGWKEQIETEATAEERPIPPQRVIAALNRCVADDAVIALDVGDHVLWFNRIFQAVRQDILLSGRWRTLGFGLPAAMAAKLAYPDRQVIALVGDGGFGTTLSDLLTAVSCGLPLTILCMNNGTYAMEQNRMITAGLSSLGSDLHNPDFVRMAESFGAEGLRVKDPAQLEPVLQSALASDRVTLVDVLCDDTVVPHTQL